VFGTVADLVVADLDPRPEINADAVDAGVRDLGLVTDPVDLGALSG